MYNKLRLFIMKYRLAIAAPLSFLIPFVIYILTLEPKLVGGDTSWFAIQVPEMYVLVPTGYPSFSIFGKLISMLPIKDLAYRLNMLSAVFGALTVLFLFLAINLLVKNEVIALSASLTFGFLSSFWFIANRFEIDSINTFYIALTIYSAFLYHEKVKTDDSRKRKYLYFCFACLGLSLTDHPIAFFVIPSLLIYIIIIKPQILKNIKAVLLSILYFCLPLSLYAFLPIRSAQGYGPIKSLKDFILYVTGRYTTGAIHGGSFGDKNFANFLKVSGDFFNIIYKNFGLILIIIAIAGLVYLFRKNLKFAIVSILLIVFNLAIITQYIGWAPENQVLDSIIIAAVFLGAGFMLIFDSIKLIFDKIKNRIDIKFIKNNNEKDKYLKRFQFSKYLIFILILILFLAAPATLAYANYSISDNSKPEEIYLFWDKIFKTVEKNSIIYAASTSANIGAFINEYEQKDKNIEFIVPGNPGYTVDGIKDNLHRGRKIYFVNVEESMIPFFNFEKIDSCRWPRFEENIVFYKLVSEKLSLKIQYQISSKEIKFGEKFTVLYKIINDNDEDLIITSLELSLPKNITFLEVSKGEDITDSPGLRQGKYMWVKEYKIKAESQLSIGIELRAESPGEGVIKFAATSQNIYMHSEDLNIIVTN
ncbi:MAG: DUF2723 domain-containing protein [Actinobacteria bacterium]|nr:DUF2723 domain-containing protein [Actinomycetota bacterium]